jgi:DNA-binding FadR family transcriptional regulator
MYRNFHQSEFMHYLLASKTEEDLPSLNELSQQMGVSVAALREQVEAAKTLGLVDVRPRTGMRRLPYSFFPPVWQSLAYAIELDTGSFKAFAELRDHIEAAYWHQAVALLTAGDMIELQALVDCAWRKLQGSPVQIPHAEHRQLHMGIFKRLENAFVTGLLEAYWQAYEAVGLNVYADYNHLTQVWTYHQQMVDAIRAGDFETGYHLLVAHQDLLFRLPEVSQPAQAPTGIG